MKRRAMMQSSVLALVAGTRPSLLLADATATRIDHALERLRRRFGAVIDRPAEYRLQIAYAYPVMEASGQRWQHESYRVNAEWTAPASTVKLPMAMFALHRLAQLQLPRSTQLRVIEPPACAAQVDEIAEFEPIERTLQRLLIVSDNGAYNRLYEFVGGDRVPSLLRRFGFPNAKLQARLGACTPADNARGRGVQLGNAAGEVIWQDRVAPEILVVAPKAGGVSTRVGRAYLDLNEALIEQPKDFQFSNHWTIADMQQLMLAIAGAEPHPLWDALSKDDQEFLRKTMRTLPREAGFDAVEYPDAWGKFLVHGDQKTELPPGLTITNKIGEAYGFLLDSAWIQSGSQQCVLSAVIYVNSDGVLNDDKYEYDSVGVPFLATLGRELLALQREQAPR